MKKYRIKIVTYNNEKVKYVPQSYNWFAGWNGWSTVYGGRDEKPFSTIENALDFINEKHGEQIKSVQIYKIKLDD